MTTESYFAQLLNSLEAQPLPPQPKPICTYWINGLCKKGSECQFIHSAPSNWPSNEKVCPFYEKGFCKNGPYCRNLHRQRCVCPNYLYGFCPDGPDCPYVHPRTPVAEENDTLESLASLISFRKVCSMAYIPIWDINSLCHKCGETGHNYKECPFAHLEHTSK